MSNELLNGEVLETEDAELEITVAEQLVTLKAEGEILADEYNDAESNGDVTGAIEIGEKLFKVVKKYNAVSEKGFYKECAAAEIPLVRAIEIFRYKTLSVMDKKDENNPRGIRSLSERNNVFDLLKLDENVKGNIGATPDWRQKLNELYCVMAIKVYSESEVNVLEKHNSENMRRLVALFDLKKDGVTGKQQDKYMQVALDAMIGEGYKIKNPDRNFLANNVSEYKGKVDCESDFIRPKKVIELVLNVCRHFVADVPYSVNGKIKEFDK